MFKEHLKLKLLYLSELKQMEGAGEKRLHISTTLKNKLNFMRKQYTHFTHATSSQHV